MPVKFLLEKDQDANDKGKKKKGKGKAVPERKKLCTEYMLWLKHQWTAVRLIAANQPGYSPFFIFIILCTLKLTAFKF